MMILRSDFRCHVSCFLLAQSGYGVINRKIIRKFWDKMSWLSQGY